MTTVRRVGDAKSIFDFKCHYDDLRGLTVTPKSVDYNVLTAGQDGIICAIDTNSCTAVSRIQMKVITQSRTSQPHSVRILPE